MYKIIGAIILAAAISGCASNTLEVTKCDKKIDGRCVKAHVIKYIKCEKPTKIKGVLYCEQNN